MFFLKILGAFNLRLVFDHQLICQQIPMSLVLMFTFPRRLGIVQDWGLLTQKVRTVQGAPTRNRVDGDIVELVALLVGIPAALAGVIIVSESIRRWYQTRNVRTNRSAYNPRPRNDGLDHFSGAMGKRDRANNTTQRNSTTALDIPGEPTLRESAPPLRIDDSVSESIRSPSRTFYPSWRGSRSYARPNLVGSTPTIAEATIERHDHSQELNDMVDHVQQERSTWLEELERETTPLADW
ncbi:uncharacterized protein BDR25DRAFT_378424 [Lindgomyces ingoldianus]|uniref:Uncharacterized protein n=1 Tax=Lindgomyces ingoldianus TaxID=673940 RepID=A0ACB6QFI7_9PLEO|nr:uncharacterized protein BDR25DRAFT_378424 [Lindgomyces ingoldianus]KAF2465754.1 hypothetical protein BDR25DRAFT_378424 [Lindgomyces ingoldianus]